LYYARLARNASLSRQEANMFYHSMFLSSAGYPLPTTYFTESQLDSAQAPVLQAMLPSMGYYRFTSRAVVFGPRLLGGIDLQRLFDHQGCGLVTLFVKHWRDNGPVGDFLRHLVNWAQYISGTSKPIMGDSNDLPHIPANILQATRKYMRTVKVTMEVDSVDIPPTQRQGDFHLMDRAVQSRVFKAAALRRINYCRLYLNAVTVADITNASGTAVRAEMWWGEHNTAVDSNGQVNRREKPISAGSWALWRKFLRLFAKRDKTLITPLGHWTASALSARRKWPYLYLPDTQDIIERTDNGFVLYACTSGTMYAPRHNTHIVPPNAVPVDVSNTPSGRLRLVQRPPLPPRLPLPEIPNTDLQSFCQHLD